MYYEYFLKEENVWITCKVLDVDGVTGNYLISYHDYKKNVEKWVSSADIKLKILENISQ